METTEPINGNDLEAVAANLIMDTPQNIDESPAETENVSDDGQAEQIEARDEDQYDADTASGEDDDAGEEYEETDDSEVQEEPVYSVKVDGVETEVSLDELKRGYSGQKYIQKGMAETAEAKKQVEEITTQVSQERQALMQMMQQLQTSGVPQVPEYPPEELRNSDPFRYLEAEAEYRRAVDKRQQFDQQTAYVSEQERLQKVKNNDANNQREAMRIAEWLPEFADPEKRGEIVQKITAKAKKHYNLSDEAIATVTTADEVLILNDALKWRELQANKSNAHKKAEGARPVRPTTKRNAQAGKSSKAEKAARDMRKTGSIDDVANFLLS